MEVRTPEGSRDADPAPAEPDRAPLAALLRAAVGPSLAAAEGLVLVGLDDRGRILGWSAGAARVTGLDEGRVLGRCWFDLLLPERAYLAEWSRFQAFRDGLIPSPVSVLVPVIAADGAERHLSLTAERLAAGGVSGVLLAGFDVTAAEAVRRQLDRKSRQLEVLSRAAQAVNAILDVPVILRTLVRFAIELAGATSGGAGLMVAGKMVFAEYNRAGKLMPVAFTFEPGQGVPGQVVCSHEPYVANDAAADPSVIPEIRAALGFRNLVNVPILGSDGSLLGCFEIHDAQGRDGFDAEDVHVLEGLAASASVALENARMLDERARNARAMSRLATAVEQSAESILITDAAGVIEYVNPAFERATGWPKEEALGRKPSILKSGRHDAAFYRAIWERLLAGEAWSGTLVNRRRDGTVYEAEAMISPVRDAAGRIVNLVGLERDVTRERRIEAQLRHGQKMEAVGRLAGGVAHDFNNLLTAINGYTDLLLRGFGPHDPARSDLLEIRRAGERAASLTRQLLAFSRHNILQPKVLDPNAVVVNLDRMLRRLIGENVELVTLLGPDVGAVRTDPGQLDQVLVNLAVNARDAMPGGGVLTIETREVLFEAGDPGLPLGAAPGAHVMLAVSDDGIGMDEETRTHLFEPFFTTKEAGKGTGLGLSTVYGIVKGSGGAITVETELGRGTTFRIYLPRVEGKPEVAVPEPGSLDALRGGETVLLVDDSHPVRAVAREALRRLGYEVLEAGHGGEALLLCEGYAGRIDLLVTDVVMPQMDGRQLAERLRASRPGLRVLFMTGYNDLAGPVAPDAAVLQKPFSPDGLGRKVREVLDASAGAAAGASARR